MIFLDNLVYMQLRTVVRYLIIHFTGSWKFAENGISECPLYFFANFNPLNMGAATEAGNSHNLQMFTVHQQKFVPCWKCSMSQWL